MQEGLDIPDHQAQALALQALNLVIIIVKTHTLNYTLMWISTTYWRLIYSPPPVESAMCTQLVFANIQGSEYNVHWTQNAYSSISTYSYDS